MRSLVIGGTLFIGRALVSKLLARGHRVTVLHRRPTHDLRPEVEGLQADRNDAASVANAVLGRRFDCVFDNVYDWERGTTGEQVEATARIFAETGNLRRYVFVSSVAAYGRGLENAQALPEEQDLAPDDHPDVYSRNKAMSERALLGMHRETGFPAVTLRVPFVYGPNNPFYRETWFWERLRDGRPILLPEHGEREMQFVHVDDLAEIQILCAETDAASGQAFNSAEPATYTQRRFVELLATAAGIPDPAIVPVPRETLLAAGGQAMQPPYYFAERLDLPPLPQDCRKMQRSLGFTARPLAQGMTQTYAWWRQQSPVTIDYSWEDRVLLEAANQFVQRG